MFSDSAPISLKLPPRTLALVAGFLLTVPAILIAITMLQPMVDPKWMYLDVIAAAREAEECCHVTFGAMSQLGILLWACVAAIGLFTALILWVRGERGGYFALALFAGLLNGWLALDDALLLHESILPGLGIHQYVVLGSYVVLGVGYVLSGVRILLRSDWWLLAIALMAVAGSLGLDLVVYDRSTTAVVLEDGLKFYGLFVWAGYHVSLLTLIQLRAPQAGS